MKTISFAFLAAVAVAATLFAASPQAATTQVVPAGKKFTLFDKKGKPFRTLNPGQSVPSTLQCVQVACPSNFDPSVVCWKCESDGKSGSPTK